MEVRRFNCFIPVTKAVQTPDGDWVVEGPLSEPGQDLEGQTMDMAGLRKGLKVFEDLGRNVDWEHLYAATKNPKWLIGKGLKMFDAPHPKTGESVPWLRTKILKSKEIGQEAITHLIALKQDVGDDAVGAGLGYSVQGGAIQKDGSHIVEPIITMVTLTPQPVVAANAGTIRLAKSLSALSRGEEVDLVMAPELLAPISETEFLRDFESVMKAMTATGGMPHEGPGASAAEVEDLGGRAASAEGDTCPVCDRPTADCRCKMIEKALAFQLSEEMAVLL